MTDHTPAAQAAMQEAVLTDERINELWIAQRQYHGGEPTRLSHIEFARAIESALLSKLRAPVADERQGDIAAALQDSAYCAGLQRGFVLGNHNDNDGLRRALESRDGYVKTIKDARAALASAPVAGEAVGKVVLFGGDLKEVSWTGGKMPPPGTTLYAAPQASEAVRCGGVDLAENGIDLVRDAALEEAAAVAKRISDKYAFGYYGQEVDTADEIERAIRALKSRAALSAQPGAQKNGGSDAN